MTQLLTLLKRMHREAQSLDGIGKGFFCSRLHKDLGKKLFAVGSVELNFHKRVLLLKTRDHRLGFFEIHRGIEDQLSFFLCPINQLLPARGERRGRRVKYDKRPKEKKPRSDQSLFNRMQSHCR